MMKLITAMVKPEKLEDVKRALFDADIHKMTVTSCLGCGQQKGYQETFRGAVTEINLLRKMRIDIAVNEEFVDVTVKAIMDGARTGSIGDGKIFITDLGECIRIRTEEHGPAAIG
jgi:nitrogen regulatory protein P-II 1